MNRITIETKFKVDDLVWIITECEGGTYISERKILGVRITQSYRTRYENNERVLDNEISYEIAANNWQYSDDVFESAEAAAEHQKEWMLNNLKRVKQ